jgi:hypothetical protein
MRITYLVALAMLLLSGCVARVSPRKTEQPSKSWLSADRLSGPPIRLNPAWGDDAAAQTTHAYCKPERPKVDPNKIEKEYERVREKIREWADPEEQEALFLVNECPALPFMGNPVGAVRAVNALQKLGEPRAYKLLLRYCELCGVNGMDFLNGASSALTVAVLLYSGPNNIGYSLERNLGLLSGPKPRQGAVFWALYPVVEFRGLPFGVAMGQMIMGALPESGYDFLLRIADSRRMRQSPLRPSDNPLEAVDALLYSDTWKDLIFSGQEMGGSWSMSEPWVVCIVRRQALLALQDIYEPDEDIQAALSYTGQYAWYEHVRNVRALDPRWDEIKQCYVKGPMAKSRN